MIDGGMIVYTMLYDDMWILTCLKAPVAHIVGWNRITVITNYVGNYGQHWVITDHIGIGNIVITDYCVW